MIKFFYRYVSVGVVNTAIHWLVFGLSYMAGQSQSISNMLAFMVAVTFSFFANARFTFGSKVSPGRYILYIGFMGAMAASVGAMSDKMAINPVITLIIFSIISLFMGFFYSKFIVFRDGK